MWGRVQMSLSLGGARVLLGMFLVLTIDYLVT